jgi:hypothetical protein
MRRHTHTFVCYATPHSHFRNPYATVYNFTTYTIGNALHLLCTYLGARDASPVTSVVAATVFFGALDQVSELSLILLEDL